MNQYHHLLKEVIETGTDKTDRTGTGTKSVFGRQTRYNLQEGFPLVTTKKVHLKSIIYELLFFLGGHTNNNWLEKRGVSIWKEWAGENGDLGPIYGSQWRSWPDYKHSGAGMMDNYPVDQIRQVIEQIKNTPDSRRMIVSAWNVSDLDRMALPPCHLLFQFYTREIPFEERKVLLREKLNNSIVSADDKMDLYGIPKYYLDCQLYQRSADLFLGVPFNIASYALLTMMIAQVTNTVAGEFIHTMGDAHIYSNHFEQVREQLSREPRELPSMWINPEVKDIDSFRYEDFELIGYNPYPAIKAPVAV